ncbi:MAG: zinc-binding dehydrogenase [Candidatus Limnocylindrales bacterium]
MDSLIEAARIHGAGDVRVAVEPADEPRPDEILLRVTAVGLCGSDLHWYEEAQIGDALLSRPLVLGHEFGGVIASGPRSGERVVVDPAYNCGTCGPCLEGNTHLCLVMRFAGHGTTDGALRSLLAWPERLVHLIPDAIADDEAPVLEPLGVALHAMDIASMALGGRAGVYGCGPIGLLLVQLLRFRGAAQVIATDTLEHRVASARAMGADETFVVDDMPGSEVSSARKLVREHEVDVAFEVSGSDNALADAIASVRPGGRVVLVGIPPGDRTSFPAAAARRKELSLLFSRRMAPLDMARGVTLVAGGRIQLAPLITHRYPMASAPEAFATLAARSGVKVVINPSRGITQQEREAGRG